MPLGPWEIAVILVILVIIFGAGRLAQVGGAVGKSIREFRGAVQDEPVPAPQVTVSAPPVACPACQAANPATNRFCSACGATIAPVAAAAGPVLPAAAPAPLSAAPPAQTAQPAEHVSTIAEHASSTQPAQTPAELEAAEPASLAPIDAGRSPGGPTPVPQNTCPSCATVNPPGQPFCGQCGTRLKPAAA